MPDLDAVFKAYDIRGLAPGQIDAGLCRRIGAAFARFAADTDGAERVLVCRDMRPTGPELVAAFTDGALGQGLDVVDVGMGSTDLAYYAAGVLDAPAAMFTASHNPAQYNGIKLCLSGAKPVGIDTGLDAVKTMAATGIPDVATDERGARTEQDLLDAYADHVRSFVEHPNSGQPFDPPHELAVRFGIVRRPATAPMARSHRLRVTTDILVVQVKTV